MAASKTPVTLRPIIVDTPPFTLNVPGAAPVEGESIPRRNADYPDGLLAEPAEGVATIFDIVKRAARTFGHANAVGSRRLVKTHFETKKVTKVVDGVEQQVDKKWTYFELSEYKYLSFLEYEEQILQLGAGLRKLGLQKNDKLFIFAATSARWLAMAHGAASQSMPIVTAYDTLGEEAITLSLTASEPKVVFFDPALIGTLSNTLKENKSVTTVVYNDEHVMKQEYVDELKKNHEGLRILSFEELRKLGEDNMVEPVPPKSDDLCCIMYTSGSMGAPKGVMLKHKNIVGAVAGITAVVGQFIGPSDAIIAYLPLAHIFEFVVENASLFWGSVLGYGTAKTLSDGSMKNCKGDIRELRPTVMVGVPTIWEGIRKGIVDKVEKQGMVARTVFWAALAMKSWMCKHKLPGSDMFDSAIFGKVRDATGGRLRACANGAGPISQATQNFISMVVAPMISGYGMTESSGMGGLGNPNRWTSSAIGDIPACAEIKLVDFPEAGYFSASTPPQGEIWVRGTSVMEGYYQNEEETVEVLTPDGWLKTGDIGEWDLRGHLRIIDRKKNLVKTMNGEYIALEKLESIYRTSPLVTNICVYASPSHQKPVALIMPAEPAAKALAAANGILCTEGLKELIVNERFQDLALKEVQTAGKKGGLVGIEIVSGVVLVGDEWTPQNGLLTSALKLCRRPIIETYKDDIEAAYSRNS